MIEIKKLDFNNLIDRDIVMNIWVKGTKKAHDFIEEEYWDSNYDLVRDVYIKNSDTFLYVIDDEIKGFISILEEDFIGALFVDIDNLGKGYGRELINYAKGKYKNLRLGVYENNHRAVNFYRKNNFRVISESIDENTNEVEYIMEFK